MVQALMERNSELQALRQYLGGKEYMMSQAFSSHQQAAVASSGPPLAEQTEQVRITDLLGIHADSLCLPLFKDFIFNFC